MNRYHVMLTEDEVLTNEDEVLIKSFSILCMLLHACDGLLHCVTVVAEAGPCGDGGSNSGQGIPGGPDCLSDAVSPRPRRPQQRQVLADIHQRPATAL